MDRPYLAPLTRSVAGLAGVMLPSQSAGFERPAEHFATEDTADHWTPFGVFRALGDALRMSSGPQAGLPTRPAIGTAYSTPAAMFNLAGVANGWSVPGEPTFSRPPTPRVALGKWTPFGSAQAPLPTLPETQRMVQPQL